VESCIFARSLIDATMQDGGTKERSNDTYGFEFIQILLSNKR